LKLGRPGAAEAAAYRFLAGFFVTFFFAAFLFAGRGGAERSTFGLGAHHAGWTVENVLWEGDGSG
jgi:hypothetical protein